MVDDVIQYTYSLPPHYASDPKAVEYMNMDARRKLAEALLDWLDTHHGGIVSPIHERDEDRQDGLFGSGTYRYISLYCSVTELPQPPAYRLMGGPADGIEVQTGGAHLWRVPLPPPMASVMAYGEDPTTAPAPRVADYELVERTQAYRFKGYS